MRIFVALMFVACTSNSQTQPDAGKPPGTIALCGHAPPTPGIGVQFNNGLATMTRDDYIAWTDWQNAMVGWSRCMSGE